MELLQTVAGPRRWLASPRCEVCWILLLFFVYGGSGVPNVNEAHYLGKARHFWDSSFCSDDFFYNSQDAHTAFFFTIGWLTSLLTLPQAAWVGRMIGWAFLAVTWQRLSFELIPRRGAAVFTAALWLALIELFQMSGEWIIGGIEAKVIAYGFVFWGLHALVLRRHFWTWTLFGIGAAFHVLVGGWAVVTGAFAVVVSHRRGDPWQFKQHLLGCCLGGAISLVGLVPALALNFGVNEATLEQAQAIYVFDRLAHHLLISAFPSLFVLRHCVLIGIFFAIWYKLRPGQVNGRFNRLAGFVAGAVLLVVVGASLDFALGNSKAGGALMRYYWFRESDIFVPMAVSLGFAIWLSQTSLERPRFGQRVFVAAMVALALHLTVSVMFLQRSWIPQADRQGGLRYLFYYREWRDMCRWVESNTPTDALFLTPPEHQTFKWYGHRAEVVNWKDVPQDAANLVEWSNRLAAVKAWQDSPTVDQGLARLANLAAEYGIDFLITRWPTASPLPPEIQPLYRNRRYALFTMAQPESFLNDARQAMQERGANAVAVQIEEQPW